MKIYRRISTSPTERSQLMASKNWAQFSFWSTEESDTVNYGDHLITDTADGKYLDVSTNKGVEIVINLFGEIEKQRILSIKKENIRFIRKADLKRATKEIETREKMTGPEFLSQSDHLRFFLAQAMSDYYNGIILRDWLARNGYNGYTTNEVGMSGKTIAIIN